MCANYAENQIRLLLTIKSFLAHFEELFLGEKFRVKNEGNVKRGKKKERYYEIWRRDECFQWEDKEIIIFVSNFGIINE